ncbi:MAG: hypothetical protein IT254_01080 [Chitinophagaceae bacterium]|nr:hypothetical protein [Chitinophagaceae bacterium]
MNRYIKHALLVLLPIGAGMNVFAQRDTTRQSINITTSFKPVLRNAVKVNLSGSQLLSDSVATVRPYIVPSQNLFYAYQPVAVKPLVLQQDTSIFLGDRNYVKAGFGNLLTPYAEAGLGFGDGKSMLINLYGRYISSKGKIEHQKYSLFDAKATGSYFTDKLEIAGAITMAQHYYRLYGYDHNLYHYNNKDVQQLLQDLNLKAWVRNIRQNDFQLSYNPSLSLNLFSNRNRLNETGFVVDLPVEKRFGDNFALKVAARANLTYYSTRGLAAADTSFSNNVFQLQPDFTYSSPALNINAGVIPTWYGSKMKVLPNVYAEAQISEDVLSVQAGFVGRYVKNTYQNLSEINSYLARFTSQTNTLETEYYGGIKANFGKHFKLNAKAGLVHYENLALFVNDTLTDGKAFNVLYEPKANNFRIRGDLSYVEKDKFSASAGITFNGYTGLKQNARAWGTQPIELNASVRWWAFNQVMLKADFEFFAGSYYLEKGNLSDRTKPGADLSAGAEFRINKQFSAWLNINNIFNNKYERWHRYEVYGLNLLGGIRFNF